MRRIAYEKLSVDNAGNKSVTRSLRISVEFYIRYVWRSGNERRQVVEGLKSVRSEVAIVFDVGGNGGL